MLSSPAIIRSKVDLPQPEGHQDDELAIGDLDIDAMNHIVRAERLLDAAYRH
jgi:hypothetical protein